jgi:TolA-binding protein
VPAHSAELSVLVLRGAELKIDKFAIAAMVACTLLLMSVGASQAQESTRTDKALFDRAMLALNNSEFAQARSLMEKVIDSYPDSQYVPIAKFSIGDAWYEEGNYKQAEMEYRDFVTFFPNRPEAG